MLAHQEELLQAQQGMREAEKSIELLQRQLDDYRQKVHDMGSGALQGTRAQERDDEEGPRGSCSGRSPAPVQVQERVPVQTPPQVQEAFHTLEVWSRGALSSMS